MDQTERLIRKGLREEKRERLEALKIKVDRLVKDINMYTFRYDTEDVASIKDEHLLQAAHELQETLREARALEKELQGE
ncbi:MAG: hypothetical protein BZ151_13090 [Desulfobacca sp. 4484_104]|nr:MAG: hypothetical protein BZ151_13090 [Desulfobacca sp. 4484_104]